MRSPPLSCSTASGLEGDGRAAPGTHRRAAATLAFERRAGRTVLARQHVPYPFHVTRPFHLDEARRDLATLYLQSASGGIFRGDDLRLEIDAGPATALHVTSQAATVVHDTRGSGARQEIEIRAAPGSVAACGFDPLILFPGADLAARTTIRVGPGATVLLSEGFAQHDPTAAQRPFARYDGAIRVLDDDGRLLAAERQAFAGEDLRGSSPLGRWNATGSVWIVGAAAVPAPERLEALLDGLGCYAGASPLPNGAGWCLRVLAPDGGTLAAGLDAALTLALAETIGVPIARRRK